MNISEIMLTVISPIFARMLLLRWIGNSDLAEEVTSSFREIISRFTYDMRTQLKAERTFLEIGEEVAVSLIDIFETEGLNMSKDRQATISKSVADALRLFSSDPDLVKTIVRQDMEVESLSRHLLEAYPYHQELDPVEAELYRRIIREACRRIIHVASSLPSFQPDAIVELLKHSQQLTIIASETLNRVKSIYQDTLASREAESLVVRRFEHEYRHGVVWVLDKVELFGLEARWPTSRRQPLELAYVPLQLRMNKDRQSSSSDLGEQTKKHVYDVPKALASGNRILIEGEAGSGKTTLLKWIAIRSANNDFPPDMDLWNDSIPFFIRLRNFAEEGNSLPPPELWPSLVVPHVADTMPQGWVHMQLRSGRAIVLIDGLDEITAQRRTEAIDWISSLLGTYGRARYILSSRPTAMTQHDEITLKREFTAFMVESMTVELATRLIESWHKAVAAAEGDIPERTSELQEMAQSLRALLEEKQALTGLAANPLMCAMLCALHRERRREIPQDRIALYRACLSILTEARDTQRGVDLTDYPRLQLRDLHVLLQDLAYWMTRNDYVASAPKDEATARLEYRLKQMIGLGKQSSHMTMKYLIERTGLIREPVDGAIDFVHRTFQEFLTAEAVVAEADVRSLSHFIPNDQWREVIILVAGLAATPDLAWLMEKLLELGEEYGEEGRKFHLLALACLETRPLLNEKARAAIRKHLQMASPPKGINDDTEVQIFSFAQDLALPYLRFKDEYQEEEGAACIRTLARIGGSQALNEIAGIVKRIDSLSWLLPNAVSLGWQEWGSSESFKKRILQPSIVSWQKLVLPESDLLPVVQEDLDLSSLEGLAIDDCAEMQGWDALFDRLSKLPDLKAIHFFHCVYLADFFPFTKVPKIETIVLSDCPNITTVAPLSKLVHLDDLCLYSFPKLFDISSISEMKSLTNVILFDCPMISSVEPLAALRDLTFLRLVYCPLLTDISALSDLSDLRYLTIRECSALKDYSPIFDLPNLKKLTVDNHVEVPAELESKIEVTRLL